MIFRRLSVLVFGAILFAGYLAMARTIPINADAAGNALQAWDMWHANPLLHGWTLSDVSFYSTELPQFAAIELFTGLSASALPIAAAMTYALIVVLVALLAKGTGPGGTIRAAIAVLIVVVPLPGVGYQIALGEPNHRGTAVPLLLAWLLLDRFGVRRWTLVALTAILALAQVADPLALYMGALPVLAVSGYRLWRTRRRSGDDRAMLIAALASVVIGRLVLGAIHLAGGFTVHAPPMGFSSPATWPRHLALLANVMAVNFHGYLPNAQHPIEIVIAVLGLCGLVVTLAAIVVATRALIRHPDGDRVNQLLVVAILVNLGAFVVSTLPTDLLSARQVAVALPAGAVLAARTLSAAMDPRRWAIVLTPLLLFTSGVFAWHATQPPAPEPRREIVAWLENQGLRYGLGGYWTANDLTLLSGAKIRVAPVIGVEEIKAYHWESRAQWYDPGRYDARFIVLDTQRAGFGSVESATRLFGAPLSRRDFGRFTVLVYDHNLLADLANVSTLG